MPSWKEFDGLNNIVTEPEHSIGENILKNELSNVSNGYMISHAETAKSGWSFGGAQMDLSVNKEGQALMKDILDHEYGEGFYTKHESALTVANDPFSINQELRDKIDTALSSEYGKQKLDDRFVQEINEYMYHLEKAEDKLGVTLSSGEKLMLADYHNQYNLSLSTASSSNMMSKMEKAVEEKGAISTDDLKSLFETTKYYKDYKFSQESRVLDTYYAANNLDKFMEQSHSQVDSSLASLNLRLDDLLNDLKIQDKDQKQQYEEVLTQETTVQVQR